MAPGIAEPPNDPHWRAARGCPPEARTTWPLVPGIRRDQTWQHRFCGVLRRQPRFGRGRATGRHLLYHEARSCAARVGSPRPLGRGACVRILSRPRQACCHREQHESGVLRRGHRRAQAATQAAPPARAPGPVRGSFALVPDRRPQHAAETRLRQVLAACDLARRRSHARRQGDRAGAIFRGAHRGSVRRLRRLQAVLMMIED